MAKAPTQDHLDKLWDVIAEGETVLGWSADDQGDAQLLVPTEREHHQHYERKPGEKEWKTVKGMWAKDA